MEKSKLLLVLAFIISSCSGDENGLSPCAKIDQYNELSQAKEAFTSASINGGGYFDIFVYQAWYRGNIVFIEVTCCPSCNTVAPAVRTRDGQLMGYLGTDIDYDILKNATIICRTNNGVCP